MEIVDTRGMLCPQPLIVTKRAINKLSEGTQVEVLYDNETAKDNLLSFLRELKIEPSLTTNAGGDSVIRFVLGEGSSSMDLPSDDEIVCPVESATSAEKGGYVVAIRSELMGEGDPKLGAILLRAFINTLPDSGKALPSHIVLYNSGVRVALTGVDCAESLAKLEEMGVKIIACGTCLDYYEVKSQLAVGKVGNMLDIAQTLVSAHHVVYL
ncbi:MAG: sulfurtransferase-like selenium metabolism protein YedF [Rikenellaceae bacterium]